jgi:putative membrane protein
MLADASVYLTTLPNFLAYFAVSLGLSALFLVLYTWVTPHREWALIRAGNVAAATSLSGAGLGFLLPLASTIAHSQNWLDMVVWGLVAVIVQLLTFLAVRLLQPALSQDIAAGKMAPALTLASISLGVGILNAACLTW